MTIGEIRRLAIDQHLPDFCSEFKDIAIGDDEVGHFPDLDRADQFIDTKQLCGVEGCPLQCLLPRESEGGSSSGVIGQQPDIVGGSTR